MSQVPQSRLRRYSVLLGTMLLLLVTSVQAVHVICHQDDDPADTPAAHDMRPHATRAPCMLCVNAHSPARVATVARILPSQSRATAFIAATTQPGSHRNIFGLYVRPPPSL